MTKIIHVDPERIGHGLWLAILDNLKRLWSIGIDTVMYCGRIWRIRK